MTQLFKGAVLLDAETQYEKRDILISNDVLTAIEPHIPESGAETVIDLSGYTVMPCFVDCHVHVCSRGGPSEAILKGFAEHGISAVKDMGLLREMPLEEYMTWLNAHQTPEYARVMTAGRYIDVAEGYGMGPQAGSNWGIEIKTPEDAAQAVAYQAVCGVSGIKTGLADGFVGPVRSRISRELLTAMAEAARAHGLWSSIHIGRVDDLRTAVECGVAAAAHTPGDRELDDACIELMLKHGVSMTTTVGDFMNSHIKFIPLGYHDVTDLKMHQAIMLFNLKKFYDAGGMIGVGTDRQDRDGSGGNSEIPVWELAQLHSIGIPMNEVIRAGTVNAAKICGLQDEGLLRVGMKANLLAFQGELDASFEQLRAPQFVMNRGKVLVDLTSTAVSETVYGNCAQASAAVNERLKMRIKG